MISKIIVTLSLLFSTQAFAEEGSSGSGGHNGPGISAGIGFPFLAQVGGHYFLSEKFSFHLNYNLLDVSVGDAKAKLSMPEIGAYYHPMSGSFFVGLGIGRESLDVSATDETTSQEVKAEVDATTFIAKLGWMWGRANGGFWFGMDISYIKPLNSDVQITAPGVPVTDQDYLDVQDAAEKFGDTAFWNITFARFGYIF